MSSNPDPDIKMTDSADPNPDPDIRRILQFLERYLTPGYSKTLDPDNNSKIIDLLDKNPNPDTLKLPGYPIFPKPIIRNHIFNFLEIFAVVAQKRKRNLQLCHLDYFFHLTLE